MRYITNNLVIMKSAMLFALLVCSFCHGFAQQNPTTGDALLLDYYQNQRFAEAADYLKKTYPEPISDMKVLSSLAYSSQMAGKLPDAEGYYQRIYVADTTNVAVLFHLGVINARRGDNTKALTYYKKILQRDSTNLSVYKQMATLSQNSGNISGVIGYLLKANKLNPVEPDVAFDLANFYKILQLYGKADSVVTTALRADSSNLLLLFGKAQAIYHLKKYPETISVCTKLMQAGNQSSMIINMLGTSYHYVKNYTNCINIFQLMEAGNTASETSYYYTAMSFKALGKQALAVTYFNKAIKEAVSPNVNSYYSEMGDSYENLHQVKKAANAYQKSLLYGVIPLTYYSLANVYDTELKNKRLAVRYFRKYIHSNPPEGQQSYMNYSKKRIGELSLH
jgi:tetratricopeptide (TPR) repeat protein